MNQLVSSLRRLLPALGLFALSVAAQPALAQDPGSGGPQPGPQPDPTAVPLDGGASLLLAGGAAYALNRLRKGRKAA